MKNLKGFSHFILTKYNTQPDGDGVLLYDKSDAYKWMKEREKLFEETKKSVLSQEGDFKWIISVDSRTPKKFLDKIQTDKRILLTNLDIRMVFLSGEVKPKTEWVITTRLDNDDQYLPGAILAIQQQFRKMIMVIDIDYQQLNIETGIQYTSERSGPNSPFLSLVEPGNRVMTAFCRPHYKILDGYPTEDGLVVIRAHKIRKPYAYMVIHGKNMFNKIVGRKV